MLRFAQSPTRDMNLSDLRIAIYNYIVSKQKNEDLVVRIDDTDKQNVLEGKDKEVLEFLNLFSIEYSRAVYQSDSLKYHQKMAMQLMGKKKAFACFCSDDKLSELEEEAKKKNQPFTYDGFCENLSDELVLSTNAPFRVRMKKPEEEISFNDLLRGELTYSPTLIDSFPILTQEKTSTYNYACAIDDMILNISTVIRDEEHLLNSARQIHVRQTLGYDKQIDYLHLPKVLDKDSKDDISVKYLIDQGFLPSAIANYLVLLGNKTPKEIFSLEEAIEWFEISNISKEIAEFDLNKLESINKKHLKEIEDMRLSKLLGYADNDLGKLAKLFLDESSTLKQIKSKMDLIFSSKATCEGFEKEFVEIKLCLQDAPFFENFDDLKSYITQKTGLSQDRLEKPLKVLLTNRADGPALNEIYPLIKNYMGEIVK